MITARSCIVKAPPGRYQMVTILSDLVRHCSGCKRNKAKRKEYEPYRWQRKKAKAHAELLARLEQIEQIKHLPDDESELWSRPALHF